MSSSCFFARAGFLFRLFLALGCADVVASATAAPPSGPRQPLGGPRQPPLNLPKPKIPEPNLPAVLPPGSSQRFEDLFEPFSTDTAALSPDGRNLAYTLRNGTTLSVLIVAVDQPGKIKTKVDALNDEDATPMMRNTKARTPAAINWLRWATPDRLVAETNAQPALNSGKNWSSLPGVIVAFDADGSHAKTLVTPRDVALTELVQPVVTSPEFATTRPDQDPTPVSAPTEFNSPDPNAPIPVDPEQRTTVLGRRPRAIDFIPGEPESLIVRAEDAAKPERPGRSELYKINVRTGKTTSLGEEIDYADYALLLDRQGRRGVSVPNTTKVSFPHRFSYYPMAKNAVTKPLDQLAGFGQGPGFSVFPGNFFGERAVPVGFDTDPAILYYASNVGRDTYAFYGLNVKTGKPTEVAIEHPTLDLYEPLPGKFATPSPLVFDRFTQKLIGVRITDQFETTRWLRPEWQAVQALLEQSLPGRSVEILEWDESGQRFLVLARGPTDPGAFYIFDRATKKLSEFVRRAPFLDGSKSHPMLDFSLNHPDGGRITGVLTLPYASRVKPIPVVVLCQPEPWMRVSSEYQPAVQALADMGLCVVQLNTRCAWGSGRQQRETVKNGFETVAAGDTVLALDWLEKRFAISHKRVVVMGEGRGAYLALRTAQLYPDRFLSVVALEPTVDLGNWIAETRWSTGAVAPVLTRGFFGDDAHLKEASLLTHPESIKSSVLLLSYRGAAGEPPLFSYSDARRLEAALQKQHTAVQLTELSEDYMQRLPRAKAAVFRDIESFLTENLYNYHVDVGEPEKKKE